MDGIIDGSWNTWALEIKTSPFESAELRGLLEFCRRYPRYRPLVITAVGAEGLATRFGLMEQHYKHKQARVTATHGKYPNA